MPGVADLSDRRPSLVRWRPSEAIAWRTSPSAGRLVLSSPQRLSGEGDAAGEADDAAQPSSSSSAVSSAWLRLLVVKAMEEELRC